MPPRDPALPEGTDRIIQGAAQNGTGGSDTTAGGGSSSGFVATSSGGDDTGGTAATGGGSGGSMANGGGSGGGSGGSGGGSGAGGSGSDGSSGSGSGSERIRTQVREQIYSLKDQAAGKARQFADDGKGRATSLLDDFSAVIDDAARAIDERLGSDYGTYAHRAAGSVTNLAETLRGKDIDELVDDTRSMIRRSPGIAIGIAAIAGFALVRVLKTGLDDVTGSTGRSDGGASGGGA